MVVEEAPILRKWLRIKFLKILIRELVEVEDDDDDDNDANDGGCMVKKTGQAISQNLVGACDRTECLRNSLRSLPYKD